MLGNDFQLELLHDYITKEKDYGKKGLFVNVEATETSKATEPEAVRKSFLYSYFHVLKAVNMKAAAVDATLSEAQGDIYRDEYEEKMKYHINDYIKHRSVSPDDKAGAMAQCARVVSPASLMGFLGYVQVMRMYINRLGVPTVVFQQPEYFQVVERTLAGETSDAGALFWYCDHDLTLRYAY